MSSMLSLYLPELLIVAWVLSLFYRTDRRCGGSNGSWNVSKKLDHDRPTSPHPACFLGGVRFEFNLGDIREVFDVGRNERLLMANCH